MSDKNSQKLLDHAKPFTVDAFETAEGTSNLIGNKIADKITKVSKIHNKIIQKQLQINMIKKYLKK